MNETKHRTTYNFGSPLGFLCLGVILGFLAASFVFDRVEEDHVQNGFLEHGGKMYRVEQVKPPTPNQEDK